MARASSPLRIRPGRGWDRGSRGTGRSAERLAAARRASTASARSSACCRLAASGATPTRSMSSSCNTGRDDSGASDADDDHPTVVAARGVRLQRSSRPVSACWRATRSSSDISVETFTLPTPFAAIGAEGAGGSSAYRSPGPDARRARPHQQGTHPADQRQLGALDDLLALPSEQRDEQSVTRSMPR